MQLHPLQIDYERVPTHLLFQANQQISPGIDVEALQ